MEREDLIYVAWRLDARETGTVVAFWAGEGGRVKAETFEIHRSADWAELPGPVAWIVQRQGGPGTGSELIPGREERTGVPVSREGGGKLSHGPDGHERLPGRDRGAEDIGRFLSPRLPQVLGGKDVGSRDELWRADSERLRRDVPESSEYVLAERLEELPGSFSRVYNPERQRWELRIGRVPRPSSARTPVRGGSPALRFPGGKAATSTTDRSSSGPGTPRALSTPRQHVVSGGGHLQRPLHPRLPVDVREVRRRVVVPVALGRLGQLDRDGQLPLAPEEPITPSRSAAPLTGQPSATGRASRRFAPGRITPSTSPSSRAALSGSRLARGDAAAPATA